MLRTLLLVAVSLLVWTNPVARAFTAGVMRTGAEVLDPGGKPFDLKGWAEGIVSGMTKD